MVVLVSLWEVEGLSQGEVFGEGPGLVGLKSENSQEEGTTAKELGEILRVGPTKNEGMEKGTRKKSVSDTKKSRTYQLAYQGTRSEEKIRKRV